MIIDMRVRPPIKEFLTSKAMALYDEDNLEFFARFTGTTIQESIKQKSLELFFQEIDRAGITQCVLPARKTAGVSNETIAEFVAMHSDRFIGIIHVTPMDGISESLDEIDRFIVKGNCKGVILEPDMDSISWKLDDSVVYPVYEKCQEYNIPVLYTIGGLSFDFASRTTTLPALEKISSQFPYLKIVLCHGAWPAVNEIIQMALCKGNIYLSPDLYFVNGPFHQEYVQAANHMLSDRILFGSAYPLINSEQALDFYKQSGFSAKVLPKVLGENALELFSGKQLDVKRVKR